MENISRSSELILVICLAFLFAGCTTTEPQRVQDLVADVSKQTRFKTGKTLTVLPVTGGEKKGESIWVVNTPKIENDKFQKLLVGSLYKSDMFKQVTTAPGGDYALRAEIIFQDISVPAMDNTLMLLVRYELTDIDKNVIWKEHLYTQDEMSTEQIFVGNTRIERLHERGLVKGMNALINTLGKKLGNRK